MASIVTNLAPLLPLLGKWECENDRGRARPALSEGQGCRRSAWHVVEGVFTLALREHLWRQSVAASPGRLWMKAFGGMRELHAENKRIEQTIAREFEPTD